MRKLIQKITILGALLSLILLSACASGPGVPAPGSPAVYTSGDDQTLFARYAPVFLVENNQVPYNRIGTPQAIVREDGREELHIDPAHATFYARKQTFTTANGIYTNLIYRVHFAEIPGGWKPFYLGAGRNIGLLVVVTLDLLNQPLLYTTVHTCGCYLAFTPTSRLSAEAFPRGWNKGQQSVYGEFLPGFLDLQKRSAGTRRPVVVLRDGTHRVKDIRLAEPQDLQAVPIVTADLQPLEALKALPLANGRTTSFYETAGSRQGYVKGSYKVRERWLMSWWAFDWRVGEDKIFGTTKSDGINFYTSLKPWARDASDMRDFAVFLDYWGWGL
ncbi:MAG: hypothetical protein [Olavius algarvensis Delta 4 endosymbiont]|nr:MAG: hypothetical protein [Olavius algarvensis Delta 4 endosymbiont]